MHYEPVSCKKIGFYYPKNPCHSEGLYNQEMSSKVAVMVHHDKPECLVKRLDCGVDASNSIWPFVNYGLLLCPQS